MSAIEQTPSTEPLNGGTPASVPEPPAGAEIVQPSPAPANESRRDTIERNFKALHGKPRDDRGKFAPNVPRETLPAAADPSAAVLPQRPAMPKSLKKELESHWNQVAPEFASALAERETQFEKGLENLQSYKTKAQQADALMNEFKPYEAIIQQEGGSPQGAIRDYLKMATVFRTGTPAQKAQAVVQIMQQYSVPSEHLQQVLSGKAPAASAVDPNQITQLVQQQLSAFQQQQAEAEGDKEVERFAANPEHPHFAAVQDWMSDILASSKFRADHQGKTAPEKLKAAYDLAVRMDPSLSPAAAQPQAVAQAQAQVAQARKAAVLVKGSPPTGAATKIDPKDRRAFIENQFRVRR